MTRKAATIRHFHRTECDAPGFHPDANRTGVCVHSRAQRKVQMKFAQRSIRRKSCGTRSRRYPKSLVPSSLVRAFPQMVQAACYQLVLDRALGSYEMPEGWAIIAAGEVCGWNSHSCRATRVVHGHEPHVERVDQVAPSLVPRPFAPLDGFHVVTSLLLPDLRSITRLSAERLATPLRNLRAIQTNLTSPERTPLCAPAAVYVSSVILK